ALLKTLEEPPPHVKFLLATTDPQKVPVTVLSRCLQLNLKRLPLEQIRGQFEHILAAEEIEWEAPALDLLARAADGSMRDGLSLLDQAIGYGGGSVREVDVKAMLGIIAQDRLPGLLRSLAGGDATALLEQVAEMAEEAPDFSLLLKDLLLLLHRMALIQSAPQIGDASWGDLETCRELSLLFEPEELQLFYEIALRGQRDLPLAPDPRSGFEMILLRMLAFRPESVPASGQKPQAPVAHKGPERKPAKEEKSQEIKASVVSEEKETPVVKEAVLDPAQWDSIVPKLKLPGISAQLAAHCAVKAWDGQRLVLALSTEGEALATSATVKNRLRQALEEWLQSPVSLQIERTDEVRETPARKRQREERELQAQTLQSMKEDPVVRALEESFDAQLIEESVELIQPDAKH
ncbi:MAG TPA: DNA polymerase III subunit gamma/tau, partial [Chromatiaceae bacterium]|nr:DNA polymerase III subunit gamma/tau [Chromatiaceae bacterium]